MSNIKFLVIEKKIQNSPSITELLKLLEHKEGIWIIREETDNLKCLKCLNYPQDITESLTYENFISHHGVVQALTFQFVPRMIDFTFLSHDLTIS